MKKYICIILIFMLIFILCGCNAGNYTSEQIQLLGRSFLIEDNTTIIMPEGYFTVGYERVVLDEGKIDLIIHFEKDN